MNFRWVELSSWLLIHYIFRLKTCNKICLSFLRFYLTGPNKGKKELFAELPGFSESIRLTEYNTVLVPFLAVIPKEPSLFGYLSKFAPFRAILGYVIKISFKLKVDKIKFENFFVI